MKFNLFSRAGVGLLVLGCCLSIPACHQQDEVIPVEESPAQGEPTAVVSPTGEKISQSIGANGGVLRSADGKVSLSIPAGALAQTTMISLQPIENKAFMGIGPAYEFSPDGLKFAIGV